MTSDAVSAAIGEIKERVVETYTTGVMTVTTDTEWSITGSKPGYYPLCIEYMQGWSAQVLSHPEIITHSNGSFFMKGFASAIFGGSNAFSASAQVTWVKL